MSTTPFARHVMGALWGGAVAAAGVALVGGPPGPPPLDAGLVAHVSGLLGGYLVAVMLLLMSRTPVLERRVGSDVLARWHGRGGRMLVGLVVVHAGAATVVWAQSRGVGPVTAVTEVLALPWLMAATIGTGLFLLIAILSVRASRRRVSYSTPSQDNSSDGGSSPRRRGAPRTRSPCPRRDTATTCASRSRPWATGAD